MSPVFDIKTFDEMKRFTDHVLKYEQLERTASACGKKVKRGRVPGPKYESRTANFAKHVSAALVCQTNNADGLSGCNNVRTYGTVVL